MNPINIPANTYDHENLNCSNEHCEECLKENNMNDECEICNLDNQNDELNANVDYEYG